MNTITKKCIDAYHKHKHLKLAAKDVGIPWQTVYVHLINAGVPVTGDKSKYGSEKDRLAAKGEKYFKSLVPFAVDMNDKEYQSKIDFAVNGYTVDVKTSNYRVQKGCTTGRWAFSLKKQERVADFFVCIAYKEKMPRHVLLFPGDLIRHYQSVSISAKTRTKWWDYEIEPRALEDFFKSLPPAF